MTKLNHFCRFNKNDLGFDMKYKWRILHLAATRYDSDLLLVSLARKGIKCKLVRVENKEDFVAGIERGGFDLILADYSLRSFDDLSAMKIARRKCPEVPFIFLSGAIGKGFATETLCIGLWSGRN